MAGLDRVAQLSLAAELGRERLRTSAYDEGLSNANPFEAHLGAGRDRLTVTKASAALARDAAERISFALSGSCVHGFDRRASVSMQVPGIGTVGGGPGRIWCLDRLSPEPQGDAQPVRERGRRGRRLTGSEAHAKTAVRVGS